MSKNTLIKRSKSLLNKSILLVLVSCVCSFLLASCVLKKTSIPSNQYNSEESIRLDFDIILKEVENMKGMKIMDYRNHELLATLKQTNQSSATIKVETPAFIVYENYEIINVRGANRDSLIGHYDYSIVFDPETYNDFIVSLPPNHFSIDTVNLVNDFNFYLSGPDTLLIRIKKHHLEDYIYSNWDTLIIR